VANPENAPPPDEGQVRWDSLNCDTVEVILTGGDYTVRPMRESLRKRLKPPYNGQPLPVPPKEPPVDEPPA
jgi:hypothetical protein